MILYHHPYVVDHAFRAELEHMAFSNRADRFAAWCEARTGYPLIDAAMRQRGQKRLSIEGYQSARWVVQDYGDIVVHVFDADTRAYYCLEDLWGDAPRVAWEPAESNR